jgi:hypothetical protein
MPVLVNFSLPHYVHEVFFLIRRRADIIFIEFSSVKYITISRHKIKSLYFFRGFKSDPDWIQTNDLQLRRLPLYSAELPDLILKLITIITFNQ